MAEWNKNIDDLFRDGLGDYTETPDPSVWNDVGRKLDAGSNRTGGAGSGDSGRRLLFWLVAGIALFFTARWAISSLSGTKPANSIAITSEANSAHVAPLKSGNKTSDSSVSSANTPTETSATSNGITNKSNDPDISASKPKTAASKNAQKIFAGNSVAGISRTRHTAPIGPTAMLSSFEPQLPLSASKSEVKASEQKFVFQKEYFDALQANTAFSLLDNKTDEFESHNVDLEQLIKRIKRRLAGGGLQGGLKLGFEAGFNSYSSMKMVVSPYIQYNVSPRLSVMIQPGLKLAHLTKHEFIDPEAYYNITNSSVTTGHTIQKGDSLSGAPDTITRRYYYKQTHDSILIGFNAAKRNYLEFELPVLLQYQVNSKFSVFGGINFNFGKVLELKENRSTYNNITRTDSMIYPATLVTSNVPTPPVIDSLFTHSVKPYSNYSGNNNLNPTTQPMRVGYTLGVSYSLKEKWKLDLLIQQTLTDLKFIPDDHARIVYKQPYFRLSIGYRLFKSGKTSQQK